MSIITPVNPSYVQSQTTDNYTMKIALPAKIEVGTKINIKITVKNNNQTIKTGKLNIKISNQNIGTYSINSNTTTITYNVPQHFNGNYKLTYSYIDTNNITKKTNNRNIIIIPQTFINATVCNITVHNYTELKNALYTTNKTKYIINLAGSTKYYVTQEINLTTTKNITINGFHTTIKGTYSNQFININHKKITLTIYNTTFNNFHNTQSSIISNKGILHISGSVFSNTYENLYGNCIENYGILKLYNNTFTNNTCSCGSVISTLNTTYIDKCIFSNNYCDFIGVIFARLQKEFFINNSTFINNYAELHGILALYDSNSSYTFNNSIFINNTSKNESLIKILGSNVTVNNCLFDNNEVINKNETKKFFIDSTLIQTDSSLNLTNTTFTNNKAGYGGIISTKSTLNINNSTFTNNSATYGGAIYSTGPQLHIFNSKFDKNKASKCGGAILQANDSLTIIESSSFTNNKAESYDGGALYILNSVLYINNTRFTNNSANLTGGAILLELSDIATIEKSSFTNNQASKKASTINVRSSNIVLSNNAFVSNLQKNSIYIDKTSKYDLDNNWWGKNIPNFTITTNNITPNQWIQTVFTNKTTNNSNNLMINMNQLSTGETYFNMIPTRRLLLKIGNTTKTILFKNLTNYIYNGTEENITAIVDHQQIPINSKLEPYFTTKNITAKAGDTVNLTAYINKDIQGQTCIKINGITLKNPDNTTLMIIPNNGIINYPYTIAKTNRDMLNVSFVYGGNNKYQSYRLNSTITLININQTENKLTIKPTKQEVLFTAYDKIAIPGKTVDLTANINKDATGTVTIKINNTILTNVTINNGKIQYTYTVPISWNNAYYKIQKVTFEYKGNSNYKAKTITMNLYIQPDNTTFNLKKYGLVTEVRDQGESNVCWAFGLYSTLESDILKQKNQKLDFSENNIKNILSKNSFKGVFEEPNTGKSVLKSVGILFNWIEPVYESKDYYNDKSIFSLLLDSDYHIQDIILVPDRNNELDNNIIKEYVLQYGAVGVTVHPTYQNEYYWYDGNSSHMPSHVVSIVGWDDSYSREYFNDNGIIPEGNGAFIVKNSWGTNSGYEGYSYISYYDLTLAGINNFNNLDAFVFNLQNTYNYSDIYSNTKVVHYKINQGTNTLYVRNNYVSTDNEIIQAIGTYLENRTNYTVYIYKNNKLQYQQEGTSNENSLKTIQLKENIPLKKGDNFSAVIKIDAPYVANTLVQNDTGMTKITNSSSFISVDGIKWINLAESHESACLNVYTQKIKQTIETKTSLDNNNLNISTRINSTNINANIKYYVNGILVKEANNIKTNTYSFVHDISSISRKEFNLTTVMVNDGEIITECLDLIRNPTYTKAQLLSASDNLREYINSNHIVPSTVQINGDTITINDYLYLISKLIYTNDSVIELPDSYQFVNVISNTNCYNIKINLSDYRALSKEIKKCYETYGRNPKNIRVSNNYMSFEDIVYLLSGAGLFQHQNNRLPDYVTVRDYMTGYETQNVTIKCPTDIVYVNETKEIIAYFTYKDNKTVNNINATFKIDGQNIATVLINNSIAKITYNAPATQDIINLTITTQNSQGMYNAANLQKIITISKKPTNISTGLVCITKKNNNITLNIKVQDIKSNDINTGKVSFIVNGNKISDNNVVNGITTIKYNTSTLPLGINNITVKYDENTLYKASTKNIKLKIENQIKTYTYNQVIESAIWTKNHIINNTLPNQITINGTQISTDSYLYLLAQLIVNNKTYNKLSLDKPTNNINTTCQGVIINKTEYTRFAQQILNNYHGNNKQPNIIHTNFGYISHNDTILLLTDIVNNLNTKKKLPENIKINSLNVNKCQNPVEYTMTIPCYVNITLNQVIQTNNNTYDKYIVKSGENGIIKVPTTRIINITIPGSDKTFIFTNKALQNIHNLQTSASYIRLDTKTAYNCTKSYQINKNQVLIYTANDNIYIKYYQQPNTDINQFSLLYTSLTKTYTSTSLPRTNNTLYTEKVTFNLNKANKVQVLFTEGINYDDQGLKYQLYKQTRQTNSFSTVTYTQLLKTYTTPRYTLTNETITTSNNKLLRTNITDSISTYFQTNNQIKIMTEAITYQNTTIDALQTYVLTRRTINETDILTWTSYKNQYNTWIYNTTIMGIKTIYIMDKTMDIIQNLTNVTHYRNTTTAILIGINNKIYIENIDLTLAIRFNENSTTQEMLNTLTTTILVDIENQLLNKSSFNITKLYNNITTILDQYPLNSTSTGTEDPFESFDNILEEYSDCNKSGFYQLCNINENETILEALIGGIVGHSVAGQLSEIENTIANTMMNVGFIILPVAPELAAPSIIAGLFLSADSNYAFAQNYNLSRYFSTTVDFGIAMTFKRFVNIEPLIKPTITFLGRKANQKSTGISDNDIIIDTLFSAVSINVFSNNFDDMIRLELKKIWKEDAALKVSNKVLSTNSFYKTTVSCSLISCLFIEKTSETSLKYTLEKVFRNISQTYGG